MSRVLSVLGSPSVFRIARNVKIVREWPEGEFVILRRTPLPSVIGPHREPSRQGVFGVLKPEFIATYAYVVPFTRNTEAVLSVIWWGEDRYSIEVARLAGARLWVYYKEELIITMPFAVVELNPGYFAMEVTP